MLTSWKAWKLGYFKTLSGVAGWLKIQPAGMTIVSSLFCFFQSQYIYFAYNSDYIYYLFICE